MRIAVVSANGGSGRTTLVLNLAVELCRRGLRTLMVDLDPQGSLGFLLARRDDEWRGLADFLMGRVTLEKAVKGSNLPLLSLLPRGRLDPLDAGEFERAVGQPKILRAGLRNLERAFDVLVLDPPAGTGLIASGAVGVADEVLVTIRADALAVRAAIRSLRMIDRVRADHPQLRLTGILPTFASESRDFEASLIREMRRQGIPVLDPPIPESNVFRRASDLGQPVARLSGDRTHELAPIRALADLYASRISRGTAGLAPDRARVPVGRYEKFTARRFRQQSSLSEHLDMPGNGPVLELERVDSGGSFGAKEWAGFLDACLRATAGETAFAMDCHGLVIASRGMLDTDQVGCVGTRLTSTLEQSRRMEIGGGDVQTALVEFEHQWLTGVAVEGVEADYFTIGILAREPVPPRIREEIRNSLRVLLVRATVDIGDFAEV